MSLLDGIGLVGMVCAMVIGIQDLRTRRLHIAWLAAFILLGLVSAYLNEKRSWTETGISLLMIGIMVILVWGWFRLRGKKEVMDVMLGWGDVVMLFGLACWLPPFPFLVCYITATLLPVLFYGILRILRKIDTQYHIPFAAWCALAFILVFPLWNWELISFDFI